MVEGKVVRDGTPVKSQQDQPLNLSFNGTDAKGAAVVFPAAVDSDGNFSVKGTDGKGIPPGKYKLAVAVSGGGSDPAGIAKMAALNKDFAAANAKLEYEVTADSPQKIQVDVGKGTVTKQ